MLDAAPLSPPLLVLASNSPRRRDIISALAARVECVDPCYDEGDRSPGEQPYGFAQRLAEGKAMAAASRLRHGTVIGADTIVTIDGDVLGKPASEAEAVSMLERLRGRPHHVYTAVCVVNAATSLARTGGEETSVTMREYSNAELTAYVATGEPFDKAGAYGVQDTIFRPASSVDGCHLNVVGLPLCLTVQLVRGLGVPVRLVPGWKPPVGCQPCVVPPLDRGVLSGSYQSAGPTQSLLAEEGTPAL